MKCVIVTGTSQGLGEAIAKQLLNKDTLLICISRHINDDLEKISHHPPALIRQFQCDLTETHTIENMMNTIFNHINKGSLSSIALINNAATLTPICPIEKASSQDIENHFKLNLIAPAVLSSTFIKLTSEMNIDKRIINISSGAATKPFFGWNCYCSAKAGLDMLSQCISLEQKDNVNPVKIISFDPGIMDTGMQQQIRSSSEENFTSLQKFISYKTENKLRSPDFVASKIIEIIYMESISGGERWSVTDFISAHEKG